MGAIGYRALVFLFLFLIKSPLQAAFFVPEYGGGFFGRGYFNLMDPVRRLWRDHERMKLFREERELAALEGHGGLIEGPRRFMDYGIRPLERELEQLEALRAAKSMALTTNPKDLQALQNLINELNLTIVNEERAREQLIIDSAALTREQFFRLRHSPFVRGLSPFTRGF